MFRSEAAKDVHIAIMSFEQAIDFIAFCLLEVGEDFDGAVEESAV